MARVSTDGCSELTCRYHGAENMRKLKALQAEEQARNVLDVIARIRANV